MGKRYDIMEWPDTELLIGYDIRKKEWNNDVFEDFKAISKINRYYSRFGGMWDSRFEYGGVLAQNIKKENYRKPETQSGLCPVYFEYCNEFFHMKMWDNLSNMMCRNKLDINDAIVAFSVIFPSQEIIYCQGARLHELDDSKYLVAMGIPVANNFPLNYPEEWSVRGYDIGNILGKNPYMSSITYDEIRKIVKKENYQIWGNRNNFGLLDSLDTAIEECRIVNAYDEEHCPYFIWKVYEALFPNTTSFVMV